MTMQAPAPTAHAAPPPGAPPAAAPPVPGAATGAGPVAALTQASQKLQAVLQAAQANGGALPATAAADLAAVVQAIQGATGGGAPAGTAPPGPPKAPSPPPPPGVGKSVEKAELDDYTAMKVTLEAVRERLWCVSDCMREGDMDGAKTEMKGVLAMLSSIKDDAMKNQTTTVKMDKTGFAAWTSAQLEAMKMDSPEVAQERLATVKRVTAIAKASWEGANESGTEPFSVEMMTAFAPEPEKSMDLTVTEDQSEDETPAAKDTPDAKGTFAQNLSEVIKDVQGALSLAEQPEKGSSVAFANPDAPAKSSTEKSDKSAGFVWPLDMNDPEGGKAFDAPDPKTARPADTDEGWGRDPWGK